MATRGQILKYTLLPGIIPRVFEFVRSGFAHIAYAIALVYNCVRLLPPSHPYLDPGNMGRFGIRHVISEAANNLVFKRENLDQIIIFFMVIIGLVLLVGQFILLIMAVAFEQPAFAVGILTVQNMFTNPSPVGSLGPDNDLAFIMLDRVFGVAGMFNSCISTDVICLNLDGQSETAPGPSFDETTNAPFPWPYHVALHNMLAFYSVGIFIVGVLVIIYFVATIVGETAQSGTPFGQRFNKTWAPVRLIFFFALIIPLGGGAVFGQINSRAAGSERLPGMNLGQIITLNVVRLGSNFATNSWAYFNGGPAVMGVEAALDSDISANFLSQQQDLIGQPEISHRLVSDLVQFMFLAKVCLKTYEMMPEEDTMKDIEPWLVRNEPSEVFADGNPENRLEFVNTEFDTALAFFHNGNMTIRFGYAATDADLVQEQGGEPYLPAKYKMVRGRVAPLCGDVTIPINDINQPGSREMYQEYYELVQEMWINDAINTAAECYVQIHGTKEAIECAGNISQDVVNMVREEYALAIQEDIATMLEEQRENGDFGVNEEMIRMGWVGASIYYNKIAEMNGAVTAASFAVPHRSKMPSLMQIALVQNRAESANIPIGEEFNSTLSDLTGLNVTVKIEPRDDYNRFVVMQQAHKRLRELAFSNSSNFEISTGNIVIDFINGVLGSSGLFDMRDNLDVHPLAQLSTLGKGLMDATLRNAAFATAGSLTGNVLGNLSQFVQGTSKAATEFLTTMVIITVGIAAILYYILPMLPFIYFLFAVSGWIKSIFEAIVAIPLWALAHLRIDGEGLPGPGATNGYFLLLEIFTRPVLIVVGFIASISIFAALVNGLNLIFDLVVTNVGGFDVEGDANIPIVGVPGAPAMIEISRGGVDEFFFTAMYAIICYMMGLACFKLIDLIPNKILRWAGVSVSTFQENAGDPASQLTNQVYKGSLLVGRQVKTSLDPKSKDPNTDLVALTT